ncbi:MAG TPA: hypothetical protein VFB34_12230, partial [Chloroflexota bacterium]|nr:hypothetical protein [Chloroflexota bacterium]
STRTERMHRHEERARQSSLSREFRVSGFEFRVGRLANLSEMWPSVCGAGEFRHLDQRHELG